MNAKIEVLVSVVLVGHRCHRLVKGWKRTLRLKVEQLLFTKGQAEQTLVKEGQQCPGLGLCLASSAVFSELMDTETGGVGATGKAEPAGTG